MEWIIKSTKELTDLWVMKIIVSCSLKEWDMYLFIKDFSFINQIHNSV